MNAPECPQRPRLGACRVQGPRKKSGAIEKCFRSYAPLVGAGRVMVREIGDDSFGTTGGGDVPSQTMLEIFLLYGTGRTWWCTCLC